MAEQLDYDKYHVGIICALPLEMTAVECMFDQVHDPPAHKQRGDNNHYALGRIGRHNVVAACLPKGITGKAAAAYTATDMVRSFQIKVGLMVGIGGGVPDPNNDIRLGDVVVSQPSGNHGGVVQWDFGKLEVSKFRRTGTLPPPPRLLLSALSALDARHRMQGHELQKHLSFMLGNMSEEHRVQHTHPGFESDHLFESTYDHQTPQKHKDCRNCDKSKLLKREPRSEIKIFYGNIASGDEVVKSAARRDEIAKAEDVICFEMEAAGLMNTFPFLIIRGICDYADSHKLKGWQSYAAATAAAFAKELLNTLQDQGIDELQTTKKPTIGQIDQQTKDSLKRYRDKLASLDVPNPVHDRQRLVDRRGRRTEGTCEWIKENANFQSFVEGNKSHLLWISGGAGMGKTMISLFLTEPGNVSLPSSARMLYYFCSAEDETRRSDINILRGVLWQVADMALESERPLFAKRVLKHFSTLENTMTGFTSRDALWSMFAALMQDSSLGGFYILLDGLDECNEDSKKWLASKVIQSFSTVDRQERSENLRVILVSRENPQFATMCQQTNCGHLRMEDEDNQKHVNEDIERMISKNIAGLEQVPGFDQDFRKKAESILSDRAEGSFLYVGYAFQELRDDLASVGDCTGVLDELEKMPRGLHNLFERMVDEILQRNPDKATFYSNLLRSVALAYQPFTLEQLGDALHIKSSSTTTAKERIANHVRMCSPPLRLEQDTVVFVHNSAHEYLFDTLNDHKKHSTHQESSTSPDAHFRMAVTCIETIVSSRIQYGALDPKSEDDWKDPPMLRYAVSHWPYHANLSRDHGAELFTTENPFFEDDSPIRRNWWRTYAPAQAEEDDGDGSSSSHFRGVAKGLDSRVRKQLDALTPGPLHMACRLGLLGWVRTRLNLLKKIGTLKNAINENDGYAMQPLTWAAMEGHASIVETLLHHGADPNIQSALQKKSRLPSSLNSYIRFATDGDSMWSGTHTILYRAAFRGHEEVVERLLEYGADITASGWADFTVIHGAALGGNERVMSKVLQQTRRLPDKKRLRLINGQLHVTLITPIQFAAFSDFGAIVRLLLREGADPALKQRYSRMSALHCAADADVHCDTLKELLRALGKSAASEADTRSSLGVNVLHEVAAKNNAASIKLLHEFGADIHATTFFTKETAVHLAAKAPGSEAVTALLDAGAHIDAKNQGGRTALHLAAENDSDEMVELLLRRGANIEAKSDTGSTPLHLAAKKNRAVIAALLLDHGAPVNALSGKEQTPLDAAVGHGCSRAIKILRERGGVLHKPIASVRNEYPELFKPLSPESIRSTSTLVDAASTLSLATTTTTTSLDTVQSPDEKRQSLGEKSASSHDKKPASSEGGR